MRCPFGFGVPHHSRRGSRSPRLHNYKARIPSDPLDCCAAGTPSILIHFVVQYLPPLRSPGPPLASNLPRSYRLQRQSPPSNHFNDDYGPPSILCRSTPLRWPPVLIRPPFDHASLAGGLALMMTSITCPASPVTGSLLVCWSAVRIRGTFLAAS